MQKQLIEYANALSMIVVAQAIALEDKERTIAAYRGTLQKCRETIEALMKAAFGDVEIYEVGEQPWQK